MEQHERIAVGSLFSTDLRRENLSRLFERAAHARFHSLIETKIDRALLELRVLGAEIVHPAHGFYPPEFFHLEEPPLFLACLGNLELLRAPSRLAIVGSREMSFRSERWLEQNLSELLRSPHAPVIVSGGARGADQAAHLAAIRARKPTIVFLPSGLAKIFPTDLQSWVKPVLESGGLFVSLCAPGEEVRRHRFEARNRLIAAISHAVFIVEAARRSGSMMTARLAQELSRDLCVLPSFPGDPVGQGTLDLLFNGASPIRDALDLAAFISQESVPRAFERPSSRDGEESVCEPHGDEGRQLSFS